MLLRHGIPFPVDRCGGVIPLLLALPLSVSQDILYPRASLPNRKACSWLMIIINRNKETNQINTQSIIVPHRAETYSVLLKV